MARIPSADQVGRNITSGQVSIAQVDTRNVGGGLDRLAAVVNQQLDARTRYQYSQAASEFLIAKTQQDVAYDNDQEYGTIEKRYTENVGGALSKAAELIQDERVRNEFLAQHRVTAAEGTSRIRQVAFRKERDYQRGYITQQLEGVANAAMTGDVTAALDTGQALLMTARDQGYLSAEEYAQETSKFRQTTKVRVLEMMKPQERLSALRDVLGNDLPADARAKMIAEAEKELVDDQAVGYVDTAMAQLRSGRTAQEVMSGFAKIENVDVRTATENRFQTEFSRQRTAEADEAASIVSKYVMDLRLGRRTFEEIATAADSAADIHRLAQLNPTAVGSLQAAEQVSAQTTADLAQAKRDAWYDLAAMAKNIEMGGAPFDPQTYPTAAAEFRATLASTAHFLDPADFEKFAQIDINGSMPNETKSWLTMQQRFDDAMTQLRPTGMKSENWAPTEAAERAQMNAWAASLGHEPTYKEVQDYLDSMTLRRLSVKVDEPGLFTGDKRWNELSPERKQSEIERLRAGNPEAMRAVERRLGPGASPDAIRAEFEMQKRRMGGR